jgi:hypothetical protein
LCSGFAFVAFADNFSNYLPLNLSQKPLNRFFRVFELLAPPFLKIPLGAARQSLKYGNSKTYARVNPLLSWFQPPYIPLRLTIFVVAELP